jgi:hypothetical protein
MHWVCKLEVEREAALRNLMGKPLGKEPLVTLRTIWEDTLSCILGKYVVVDERWMHVPQDHVQ